MNQEAKVVLPENLNHYIADYLRRKIFCGDSYRKGDQIVERDIAEELNVSRSPVREALKELSLIHISGKTIAHACVSSFNL